MYSEPLEAFIDWLQEQPMRLKSHLIRLVVLLMPGCDLDSDSQYFCEEFVNWIESEARNPGKAIGIALALKSIVDFAFMETITGKDQWKQQAENIDGLIEDLANDANSTREIFRLNEHKRKLQFYSFQAAAMKQSWSGFCAEHFTSETLRTQI